MPITRQNHLHFHRTLYAGQLQKIYLLKRGADQRAGGQVKHVLFQCRRSQATVSGEPLQDQLTSNQRCTWHIPRCELDRVGIAYISVLDRIVDPLDQIGGPGSEGATWQPESNTTITVKLFGNHVCVECLRTDPAGV